jgi:hypothetical protein
MGIKLLLLTVSVGALLAFQNCGKAGFDSSAGVNSSASTSSASIVDSKIAAAPFPYKVTPNLISFMDCPMAEMTSNPNKLYTFKVMGVSNSSYNSRISQLGIAAPKLAPGGVALSSEFVGYMRSKFKGAKTDISSDQIVAVLQSSPNVANLMPQLGLRQMKHLTGNDLYISIGSGGSEMGIASWALPSVLDRSNIAKALADAALTTVGTMEKGGEVYVSSFPGGSELGVLSAQIGFGTKIKNDAEAMTTSLLKISAPIQNNGEQRLALSFVSPTVTNANNKLIPIVANKSGTCMGPAGNDDNCIEGLGYRFIFDSAKNPKNGNTSSFNSSRMSVIADVEESNLATGGTTSSKWDCFHLAIVRYQDRGLCPNGNATFSNDAVGERNRLKHELVRKILPANIWDVNIASGCIVPTEMRYTQTETSCYATSTSEENAENHSLDNGDRVVSPERKNWYPITEAGKHTIGDSWDGTRLLTPTGGGSGGSVPDYNAGIEYRYWDKECGVNSSGSNGRECVHFASFCSKKLDAVAP